MDTAQWPQEIVVKPIEEIVTNKCPKPSSAAAIDHQRKATRPQKEQALNCPRCNSTNTKFCYYNNYSLTQPRYFCKTCRRYWTEGGSLRNIPVGGGSRKNKRSSYSSISSSTSNISSSSSLSSSSKKQLPDLVVTTLQNPNKIIHEGQDLNLTFQGFRSNMSEFVQVPNNENNNNNVKNNQISSSNCSTTPTTSAQISALELLTGMSSRGLNSFMPIQDPIASTVYNTSGFNPMQEFKPTLHFSFDGLGSSAGGYGGGLQGVDDQESNGSRLLFPFEDLKQESTTTTTDDQNREQGASYWTGMLGGGSW